VGFTWNGPVDVVKKSGPWGVVVGILQFLAQLLGIATNNTKVLQQAINGTWANLVLTSSFLYNAVGHLSEFIQKLIGIVFGGLAHIITDILHGHLAQVIKDIQALIRALHNLFAPLLLWLRRLQAMQRQYQLQAMRRIINMIQRARQVLVLFRLLHLKFATKLDNWLAGIEGKIITRELEIASKTNELIAWINAITDPFGALRGVTVLGPVGRMLAALAGAARAVNLEKVWPSLRRTPGPSQSTVPWSHFVTTYAAERVTTAGAYGDFHRGVLQVRALLNREYNT
jgi:hypothetical protein